MRILAVLTGGTIGSSITDGMADVDGKPAKGLFALYPDTEFICEEPFSILSENSTVDTLENLCNFMLGINYDDYDGIIVTHGSDTLGYTSAVLGIALSKVKIPVMITASDYVLSCEKSNGRENFCGCVDFIKGFSSGDHSFTGVYTVWKNSGEKVKVHRAWRLEQADFDDKFHSFGEDCFGCMVNGLFVKNAGLSDDMPDFLFDLDPIEKSVKLSRNILLLQSFPGLDFNCISIEGKDAVLLKTYHSGTVCAEGGNTSFIEFAKRCGEQKTDVYIYLLKDREYIYGSSKEIPWDIVKPLFNIGECAAYGLLLFKYGAM